MHIDLLLLLFGELSLKQMENRFFAVAAMSLITEGLFVWNINNSSEPAADRTHAIRGFETIRRRRVLTSLFKRVFPGEGIKFV